MLGWVIMGAIVGGQRAKGRGQRGTVHNVHWAAYRTALRCLMLFPHVVRHSHATHLQLITAKMTQTSLAARAGITETQSL